jgi:hypothetical protein
MKADGSELRRVTNKRVRPTALQMVSGRQEADCLCIADTRDLRCAHAWRGHSSLGSLPDPRDRRGHWRGDRREHGPALKTNPNTAGGRIGYIIKARPRMARRSASCIPTANGAGRRGAQSSWSPDGKSVVYYRIASRTARRTPGCTAGQKREYGTRCLSRRMPEEQPLALTDLDFPSAIPPLPSA